MPCGERAEYDPVPGDGSQALAACLAPAALPTVPTETDRQRRAREASHRYFTEARVLSPREVSALLDRIS